MADLTHLLHLKLYLVTEQHHFQNKWTVMKDDYHNGAVKLFVILPRLSDLEISFSVEAIYEIVRPHYR